MLEYIKRTLMVENIKKKNSVILRLGEKDLQYVVCLLLINKVLFF